jgi:hypothetical protein
LKTKFQFLLVAWVLLTTSYHLSAQDVNFVLSSSPQVGQSPYSVCAADVNGDGKLDLISVDYFSGMLSVLTNDGSGGFVLAFTTLYIGMPISVCAADINGDGKIDLISTDFGPLNGEGPYNNTLTVLTNDGVGGFEFASASVVGYGPDSVCAADVNGDGKMDLICANAVDDTLTILTNDGKGGFAISSSPMVGYEPQYVCAADVNGDGKVDLVCATSGLTVLTNDGSGGFVLASVLNGGNHTDFVIAADVNGDGKMDLIRSDYGGFVTDTVNDGTLTVFTNDGHGNFSFLTAFDVYGHIYGVCAADVNGDGRIDLIAANTASITPSRYTGSDFILFTGLTVLTNDGSGNFTLAVSPSLSAGADGVIAADVNGDGKTDLIVTSSDNTLTILTNGTIFSPPTSIPPLTINSSGLGMQVSWPSVSPGWSLEQNSDLATANWGPSGYNGWSISDDGTNKSLTMPSSSGNLFFRLLHP